MHAKKYRKINYIEILFVVLVSFRDYKNLEPRLDWFIRGLFKISDKYPVSFIGESPNCFVGRGYVRKSKIVIKMYYL